MAHIMSKAGSVALDDSTGSIATISGSTISATVNGGTNLLEDTGIGDSAMTNIEGLDFSPTVALNGMIDSTTEAIFAPLTNGTSVLKTVGIGLVSGQYLNGEGQVESVEFGINRGEITTWSINLLIEAGLTRTSVAAS